jgi:signal transduction histidine kinase
VRSIVEQHGGRVGYESVDGAGSTFWFDLPRAGQEIADAAA